MKMIERGVMPHYKCEACRARLHVSRKCAEFVGNLCPECGSLLEPVTEFAQLVGLRSITSRNSDAATEESEPHQRIADILHELLARRTSILERQRLDTERDDGHEPEAAAVVLPPPPTSV
jgi:predicted RNA-binding Zn-ribbon protein involved in translation (DUF1610 family)